MIPFHHLPLGEKDFARLGEALKSGSLAGDGSFGAQCEARLQQLCGAERVLLTCSATAALELAALLLAIGPGDEIIMPSFTFPSTANAFVLRGAQPVFVDIRPGDMNIDPNLVEAAITPATRGIAPVHYGGMACDMAALTQLARSRNLAIIEDAAMGLLAFYQQRHLGTFAPLSCLSFHHSKHFSMGEGGALLINDPGLIKRAEILRQKGTDIAGFRRGQVAKYCWQDMGSSYVASELNAALLLPQLQQAEAIVAELTQSWEYYQQSLKCLAKEGYIELPQPAAEARHNGHLYYLKAQNNRERDSLQAYLKAHGIATASHYQPLHTAPAGLKYARFHGNDNFTSRESGRLLRLPLWRGITKEQLKTVTTAIRDFYRERGAAHEKD